MALFVTLLLAVGVGLLMLLNSNRAQCRMRGHDWGARTPTTSNGSNAVSGASACEITCSSPRLLRTFRTSASTARRRSCSRCRRGPSRQSRNRILRHRRLVPSGSNR